jgi:uncharacterized protein (DUF2336 family)
MLARAYLSWVDGAASAERAEAAALLAATYLAADIQGDDRADTEAALMLVLDDHAVEVRRAVAHEIAGHERAPRPLVLGLAHDVSAVSVPVLLQSPVLRDADLAEAIMGADDVAQTAVAMRPNLGSSVCSAVAETGGLQAALALAANPAIVLEAATLARLGERFGSDADMRGVLLEREDLPVAVRQQLLLRVAGDLKTFLASSGWLKPEKLERLVDDAERMGSVIIAQDASDDEISELVHVLRSEGRLTANLLLRAVLSGDIDLFATSLATLAGIPKTRVRAMCTDRALTGLSAVYARSGMPLPLEKAFFAVLRHRPTSAVASFDVPGRLDIQRIRAALLACSEEQDDSRVLAILRRYESEALRLVARQIGEQLRSSDDSGIVIAAEAGDAPPMILVEPAIEPEIVASDAVPAIELAADPSETAVSEAYEVDIVALEREISVIHIRQDKRRPESWWWSKRAA